MKAYFLILFYMYIVCTSTSLKITKNHSTSIIAQEIEDLIKKNPGEQHRVYICISNDNFELKSSNSQNQIKCEFVEVNPSEYEYFLKILSNVSGHAPDNISVNKITRNSDNSFMNPYITSFDLYASLKNKERDMFLQLLTNYKLQRIKERQKNKQRLLSILDKIYKLAYNFPSELNENKYNEYSYIPENTVEPSFVSVEEQGVNSNNKKKIGSEIERMVLKGEFSIPITLFMSQLLHSNKIVIDLKMNVINAENENSFKKTSPDVIFISDNNVEQKLDKNIDNEPENQATQIVKNRIINNIIRREGSQIEENMNRRKSVQYHPELDENYDTEEDENDLDYYEAKYGPNILNEIINDKLNEIINDDTNPTRNKLKKQMRISLLKRSHTLKRHLRRRKSLQMNEMMYYEKPQWIKLLIEELAKNLE